jgi:PAS domain S-box-containing protein
MAQTPPTLEDLRVSERAAWLWDGARARLVWANKAGIAAFDASNLFDLIDRAFDGQEPGVARVAELTQILERGEAVKALLHFPSVGAVVPFACQCWLHALADGRRGVLVVAEAAKPEFKPAPAEAAGQVLNDLPLALVVILHANGAARGLLAEHDATNLGDFLASAPRAQALLARLANAAVVATTEQVGQRDFKIVLTRHGENSASALLEDVTARRALEQDVLSRQIAALDAKLAKAPEPTPIVEAPQAASAPTAFEVLGKSIARTLSEGATPPKPIAEITTESASSPTSAPPIHQDVLRVPFVPDSIRKSLERTGKAILIGRKGEGLFATQAAATLLGHDAPAPLFHQQQLWADLFETGDGATLSLPMATGAIEAFELQRARVAWQNGPADQFVLKRLEQVARPAAVLSPAKAEAVAPAPVVVSVAEDTVEPVVPKPADAEPAKVQQTRASSVIAHDELQAILDVASDGIITLNAQGDILSFSAGAEAIFGRAKADVIGASMASLLKQDSRKTLRDYLSGLSGHGLARVFNDGREVMAELPEGNGIPLFLTISPLQAPQSRASFCAVVRDITTWKQTERDLRDAKEEAELASRKKSDFLARISHELRTPLNAIIGFSEVMRSERFGELRNDKYRAYANDINSSGEHLLALINDLLDLSKVEAGKLELNFTAESIAEATEHAMRLMQEEARTARVLMRTAFPARMPRVVADHRALRQIMLNLLSNAVKYTNAGGQVLVSASMEDDGALTVRVKDTGIGMTEQQLQDALQPFSRVETPERERQGTGLGLPLTKALAEANRARFTMTSAPNQGTLAEITFPGTRVLAE